MEVHFYFCYKWEGEPEETEEMRPQWYNLDKLPYEKMWSDDIHWLPRVLKGERLEGELYFNEDNNTLNPDKINIRSIK